MPVELLTAEALNQNQRWHAEVIFVMPATDTEMAQRSAQLMVKRAGAELTVLVIQDVYAEGFISLCNRAFIQSSGLYLGYVAQDAFPGRQWLKIAISAMQEKSGNCGGLFAFNDGKWMGMLASFGMVQRSWANSNYEGQLFLPAYRRHYADVELTLLAMDQGVYRHDARSVLMEIDWEKELKSVDRQDRQLYQQRAETGFDGCVVNQKLLKLFR